MTQTSIASFGRACTVAFVLVSYRRDEAAGMERATAALANGLRALGHRALILSAAPGADQDLDVIALSSLPLALPCDDATLRAAIRACRNPLLAQLCRVLTEQRVDVVVYVDALWGLGRLAASVNAPARVVLAVHVLGHHRDMEPALTAAHQIIAPSTALLAEAHAAGYDTTGWHVIANPLLTDPDHVPVPDELRRERLRRRGPIRAVARLGTEKGISTLLAAAPALGRPFEVVLAAAGFEETPGSQAALLAKHERLAAEVGARILPALPWEQVPAFLADAAVTLVPSRRETFGNLAAESLSAATPVVAHAVGNLPALVGDAGAGALVPLEAGAEGLWRAAYDLLSDPVRYRAASGAAYYRSRDFRPTTLASAFLKAVW
jgi:glycosyltransferase involved in cell wall biosynthesis